MSLYQTYTKITCRKFSLNDLDALLHYLHLLSDETKKRFAPHPFDRETIISFYTDSSITGFISEDDFTHEVIAYAIIKKGMLSHDSNRLFNYSYADIEKDCCTYAPSVAEKWQGKGIGKLLFNFILSDCRKQGIKKIILWGGVQSSNERALSFYIKLGFVTLGKFEYNGYNQDMLLEIKQQFY